MKSDTCLQQFGAKGVAETEAVSGSIPTLSGRLDSYDFLKGFLVEVMIIYHSTGYFDRAAEYLRYLDFVTGAFVMLSGTAVTAFYLEKYHGRLTVMLNRLLSRSAKLIVLFTVLNTCAHLLIRKNYNGVHFGLKEFYLHYFDVFVLGSKPIACFEILLPIAYTLAAGALIMFFIRGRGLACTFTLALVAGAFAVDVQTFNLKFLTIGLSGIVYGYFKQERLPRAAQILLAVTALVVVIVYFCLVAMLQEDTLFIYFIGIVSIVTGVGLIGQTVRYRDWLTKELRLYGQYSLLSYIAQIALLQSLFWSVHPSGSHFYMVLIAIVLTNVVLSVMLRILSWLRLKYEWVRMGYRLIFA